MKTKLRLVEKEDQRKHSRGIARNDLLKAKKHNILYSFYSWVCKHRQEIQVLFNVFKLLSKMSPSRWSLSICEEETVCCTRNDFWIAHNNLNYFVHATHWGGKLFASLKHRFVRPSRTNTIYKKNNVMQPAWQQSQITIMYPESELCFPVHRHLRERCFCSRLVVYLSRAVSAVKLQYGSLNTTLTCLHIYDAIKIPFIKCSVTIHVGTGMSFKSL